MMTAGTTGGGWILTKEGVRHATSKRASVDGQMRSSMMISIGCDIKVAQRPGALDHLKTTHSPVQKVNIFIF